MRQPHWWHFHNFKSGLGLERDPPSFVMTVGQLFDWEVGDLIKKVDINKLDGHNANNQALDFNDMSSFFPCEIDDAVQYINLGYGAQAPKIVIL